MRWMMALIAFGSRYLGPGKLIPEDRRAEAEAVTSKWSPTVELPWARETSRGSWLDVADAMEQTIRECVTHLWADVMAIDYLLAEVSAEFGGEDPMKPVMRGQLEKARATLELLQEAFSGKESIEDRVPSERALELARNYFDKGVNLTG